MKKIIIIFILGLILFFGLGKYLRRNIHLSEISYQQISETLLIARLPEIPEDWNIKSIVKYDDQFLTPHVIIKYTNEITLNLSRSNFAYPGWEKNHYLVGNKLLDSYERGNDIAIVFKYGEVSYNFNSKKSNKDLINTFILKMFSES